MTAELEANVVVDLVGNLQRQAQVYSESLRQFSTNGSRHLSRFSRVSTAAYRQFDRLGNRVTAFASGAAAVATARTLLTMEERFARLGVQSNKSADDIKALQQQIFSISQQPDIRIDPSQLTSAVEEIVEKTGDLEFAKNHLNDLALAISATGGAGSDIGGIGAEFQKAKIPLREALDILITQGKEGAFTLQNLAAMGPRVVTAFTAVGRSDMREMGAVLQVIRQGVGSAEQATTAFEALLRTLTDADKVKLLNNSGIQVFEDKAQTKLRSITELMQEIVEKSGGSKTRLSNVFDAESMRAFNTALTEFNQNGSITSLERFLSIQADANQINIDSQRIAITTAGAMRFLKSAWVQFADANLTKPINDLATTLTNLKPEEVQEYFGHAATGVKVLAGAIVASKLIGLVGGIAGGLRSLKSAAGGKGGLGGAAANLTPIPVFVVNGMGSNWRTGLTALGGGAGGAALAGGKGGVVTSAWRMLKNQPMKNLARMGPSTMLRALGFVGLSGTAGYLGGKHLVNPLLPQSAKQSLGTGLTEYLRYLGVDSAREASDRNLNSRLIQSELNSFDQFKQQNPDSNLNIKLSIDSNGFTQVQYITGDSGANVEVEGAVGGYN